MKQLWKSIAKAMLILFWGSATLVTIGCDQVGVKGLADGGLHFDGVQGVDWRSDGKYILTWNPIGGDVQYLIYLKDLEEVSIESSGTIQPITVGKGPRLAFRSPQDSAVSPEKDGKLLGTVAGDQSSYEIKTQFLPTHAYAFQVKVRNADGTADANIAVLYLTPNNNTDYKGCLKAESQNATGIQVEVEYPQGASEVRVFRDDILIKKVDTPSSTVVLDDGLKAGRKYTYRCEAQVGNDTWIGTETPSVEPLNPFESYAGCTEGTIDGYNAKIKFAFPENADQVVVYRNGLQVYSSRSPAGNAFVDQNLTPGEQYIYTCEVQKSAMSAIGLKRLDIRIPDALASFDGCVDAQALGASQIRVDFSFPKGADKITVFRNGVQIYNTTNKGETSFIDSGLTEGQTYKYSCGAKASIFEKIGTQEFEVTTLSTNPPSFAGIKKVDVQSATSAQIEWGVADLRGVSPAYFQIYATVGNIVEWGAPPTKTIQAGVLKTLLTDLGDELPYAFGVRACSIQDICDTNTVSIRKTMPDGGAPATIGAISASIKNGEVAISAPWQPKNGAIAKRKVYRRAGPTGGLDISAYTLVKTTQVDNIAAPPVELTVGNINEMTTYNFIVLDEDPTGQLSTAKGYVTLTTGDLTPPTFSGISGVYKGDLHKEATTLYAEFTAVTVESVANPGGASHYMLYLKEGGGDSCAAGTLKLELPASGYIPGDVSRIEITGLHEKTYYSVCMKARDSSGNISKSSTYLQKYTQDVTLPIYDGVQYASYNYTTGKIDVVWNPSSSSDIVDYRVQVWKNTTNPDPTAIGSFVKPHNTNPHGFSFGTDEFVFVGADQLYILVNGCDNANLIPEGVQNCTTLAVPFVYTVPDVTPPQGFLGVEGSNLMQTPQEGTVIVFWKAPQGNDWSDYRGFKIYMVDQANPPITDDDLIFMKDCPCSAANCPNQITSCSVSGLSPYRTYNFHVRAYDANGNITNYLSPAVYTTAKRSTDTTPPQFASNLTADYSSAGGAKINLAWAAAADNQYAQEPGVSLNYQIWRRETNTFTLPQAPETDGDATKLQTQTGITYVDSTLSSNVRYYYTVCAVDASGNRTCDGVVRSVLTPDVEPPILTNIISTKDTDPLLKQWDMSWNMTDNSDVTTLRVTIKQALSADAMAPDIESLYTTTVVEADGITNFNALTGPTNVDTYVHYLITVRDLAGNTAKATYSVYSQNRVDITAVARATGTTAGGRFIVIQGSGFVQGATVKIGLMDCNTIQVYKSTAIGCITPAQVAGAKTVTVTNPSGTGSASLPNGYTYLDPADALAELCDQAGSQSTTVFAGGTGASATPYLICNDSQLNLVRNYNSGKFFKLMDNVDLRNFTNNTFLPLKSANYSAHFFSTFDGNGLFIANWTYKNATAYYVGMFQLLYSSALIKNLNIVNADVEGYRYTGILAGYVDRGNCSAIAQDITLQGKVKGNEQFTGGAVGYSYNGSFTNITVEADVSNYSAASGSFYYLGGFSGRDNYCNFTNINVKGTVTGDSYYMGGLSGYHYFATFTGSSFDGTVQRDNTRRNQTGGGFGQIWAGTATDMSQKSQVLNTKIKAKVISNTSATGGMVGIAYNTTVIEDSTFDGTVIGTSGIGGFAGYITPSVSLQIRRSKANAVVTGTSSIGGFIGYLNWGTGYDGKFTVENNLSTGSVSGTSYVGGFLGDFSQCTAVSAICNGSNLRKNGSTATVYGSQAYVGGFAGMLRSPAGKLQSYQNYATGAVTGDNTCVGGFAGIWGADLNDSYATGKVTGVDYAAAFIGCPYSHVSDFSPTLRRVYATGKVVKGLGTKYGGLYAYQYNATANPLPYVYVASFWDKTATGMDTSVGDASQIFGKTTAEMKISTTYSTAGWDFTPLTGVWKMPAGGNAYPIFTWQ